MYFSSKLSLYIFKSLITRLSNNKPKVFKSLNKSLGLVLNALATIDGSKKYLTLEFLIIAFDLKLGLQGSTSSMINKSISLFIIVLIILSNFLLYLQHQ
jgi:hypothetical protein